MATRKVYLVIICHNLFILKSSAPSVLKVKNSSQKILSSCFLFIHLSEIVYSNTCTVTLTVLDVPKGPSTANLWKQVLTLEWTKYIFKIQNCSQKYERKPLQIINTLYYVTIIIIKITDC